MALSVLDVIILVAVAFVPSLIYLVWIRNTERYGREPYARLLRIFFYGAILSVSIAVVLEFLLTLLMETNFQRVSELLGHNPTVQSLILTLVIAPIVEEFAKSLGVLRYRRFITDIEDGLIFGAAAGLGFAATENLLYEGNALLSDGTQAFIATAVIRSISSALLHASASSVVGLGIARSTRQGRSWAPYYLAGVLMHATFNLVASFGVIYESSLGTSAYLIGLGAAILIAVGGIVAVRSKIRSLDLSGQRGARYG